MSIMNLRAGYFSIENPLRVLARWLNRHSYRQTVQINRRKVEVRWTGRAERVLRQRNRPLIVEIRLYFSCVVKKQVLFHRHSELDTTVVKPGLEITFQPIASAACEPREFAASYPPGRNLSQGRAARMVPKTVEIDYCQGSWEGSFYY
ncbi:MAG: hypothetical protein OEO19_11990 [Gammaproteobacteria bacterium]|nr:hypothetical protein [Gammaproteobacteria bacterium]MDH3448022.1 hypothetical protein [Gammaproteobacteria bacterium]